MKNFFKILGISLLSLSAYAAPPIYIPIGGGGGFDSVASSYITQANITDPNAQARINAFVVRLKTMPSYANLQRQFMFHPSYNPSNHVDLFGNTGTYVNEKYDILGFRHDWTNFMYFDFPAMQQWTVITFRRGDPDISLQGVNEADRMEWSMENTNIAAGYDKSLTVMVYTTFKGEWMMATTNCVTTRPANDNINNVGPINCIAPAGNNNNRMLQTFPTVFAVVSYGANGPIIGYQDTMMMHNNVGGPTQTNLTTVAVGQPTTNNYPATRCYVGGGSTNWYSCWPFLQGTPGTRWCTNGFGSTFSIAVFNKALSQADINIYYTAINELWPDKVCVAFEGTSMFGENANRMPYDTGLFGYIVYTNCISANYNNRHPTWLIKNYSQGGASLKTQLITPQPPTGAQSPFPISYLSLLPSSFRTRLIVDHPRNDLATPPAPMDYTIACTNWYNVYSRYRPFVQSIEAFESPLFSTNSIANYVNDPQNRSNLVYQALVLSTNKWSAPLIDKFHHSMHYFWGTVWDTNNQYYAYDAQGGYHIENTNSLRYFRSAAALIDTGEWEDPISSYASNTRLLETGAIPTVTATGVINNLGRPLQVYNFQGTTVTLTRAIGGTVSLGTISAPGITITLQPGESLAGTSCSAAGTNPIGQ